MVKRIAIGFTAVLALMLAGVVVFAVLGTFMTVQSAVGATLATGRSISAGGQGLCFGLETSKDSATIRTMRHTIVVAPTSVTIDGTFAGSIPPTARAVDVQVKWSGIQVFADGQLVGANSVSTADKSGQVVR